MVNYRIKPLEWEKEDEVGSDLCEKHEALTPIAGFRVEQWQSGDWAYHFCFDEYYDDGGGMCESLEDGKSICEKIWEDKLKKCLIKEKEG
ncbi:hypothetical protein LCGC14_1249500 [marine sediment metagenome]|uniref:Uncharacterized protein n=1 Tax=marine sediment metagenome TaxID=412755 RepID=A0A0F9NKS6_9ZZZZ